MCQSPRWVCWWPCAGKYKTFYAVWTVFSDVEEGNKFFLILSGVAQVAVQSRLASAPCNGAAVTAFAHAAALSALSEQTIVLQRSLECSGVSRSESN